MICQAKSSLPEVTGDTAIFYDPEQEERSLEAIKELYQPGFYADIVSRGLKNTERFSWVKCAGEVNDFYRYMLDKKGLG